MKIGDIPPHEFRRTLTEEGLPFRLGAACVLISSPLEQVARAFQYLYAEYRSVPERQFYDARIAIHPIGGLRRLRGKRVKLVVNGIEWNSFEKDLAFAALVWGLNWFFYRHAHQFLNIHAGTLARGNSALLLPAEAGSGKSTLTAALMHRGWRLLSDELAIFNPHTGTLNPLPNSVILKDQSIPTIRQFAPSARFGPVLVSKKTGWRVAHVSPTPESIEAVNRTAIPRLIVFPQYEAGRKTELSPLSKADGMIKMIQSGFNTRLHGQTGFDVLADVIDRCECFELTYSDLEDVTGRLTEMISDQPALAATV